MGYIYKDRAKFMELYEKGMNDAEIARITNHTKSYVNYWRRKSKLPTTYKRPCKFNLNNEFKTFRA